MVGEVRDDLEVLTTVFAHASNSDTLQLAHKNLPERVIEIR